MERMTRRSVQEGRAKSGMTIVADLNTHRLIDSEIIQPPSVFYLERRVLAILCYITIQLEITLQGRPGYSRSHMDIVVYGKACLRS